MTIGGEAREVWEQIGNENWGQQPYMNGYLNERYMLSFDLHYGRSRPHVLRVEEWVELLSVRRSATDRRKETRFPSSLLELGTGEGPNWIRLRAGRQQMEYGSGRLIDVREGPNVRLSFDGFKVMAKSIPGELTVLPCGPTWISLDSSIMLPITRSAFGGYKRPGRCPRKFLSRRIIWDWTANVHHFSGAPDRSSVTLSAQGCRGRSRRNDPIGTSTTRRSGNSEHSGQAISERGLLRLRRAIGFQR